MIPRDNENIAEIPDKVDSVVCKTGLENTCRLPWVFSNYFLSFAYLNSWHPNLSSISFIYIYSDWKSVSKRPYQVQWVSPFQAARDEAEFVLRRAKLICPVTKKPKSHTVPTWIIRWFQFKAVVFGAPSIGVPSLFTPSCLLFFIVLCLFIYFFCVLCFVFCVCCGLGTEGERRAEKRG